MGFHLILAKSCSNKCCVRICFSIKNIIPVPTIETPACGSIIADPAPWISGKATAGNSVRVCIEGYGCQVVVVDQDGEYHVNFGIQFPDGSYNITVTQIDQSGAESQPISCSFMINTSDFMVEPIDARMGRTFRTIDIDVLMSGTTGTATVYYLLLPPGSPAPTAIEIMNYQNTAALLNGTAATGQFFTTVATTPTTYTWVLTGLDKPGAPAGTTGVIDGYRYDVYIYVVSGIYNSGVLTFDNDAMGMPFATGRGTADNPFTIRELTPEELQMYPDLLANNPLNRPGVDEYARQLENIERLVTLYEETNGYYGLADSMALNYLMTSDIDLSSYASAYDGAGWEPIGDIDGWINDRKETEHLFSGVFDGDGHTITNLSITPTATNDYFVGYRGLFGGVEYGTIENLSLKDVTIDAFTTVPGFAQLGSFISTSRNPILRSLTLTGANITADCNTVSIGDTHMINIGGFVGAIFDGATVSNISGQNISISVPSIHALALGGFVGYTDKFTAYDSYENISLSSVSISGYAMIGGFAGYVVYSVNLLKNVTIDQIAITAPGGQAGGLIGLNYIFDSGGDELIENCTITNIFISVNGLGDPGDYIGGLIGMITRNTFPPPASTLSLIKSKAFAPRQAGNPVATVLPPVTTIRLCNVINGQINCTNNGGGLIGYFFVDNGSKTNFVTLCNARLPISSTGTNIGGLIGNCQQLTLTQSFATDTVSADGDTAGGLIGRTIDCIIQNSYSTSTVTSTGVSGGVVAGTKYDVTISYCYSTGNVTAGNIAGGIAGELTSSTIQFNLVLGGNISAPVAHRVLGESGGNNILLSNFALDTVTPIPMVPDPNGLDGGTIIAADIISTMNLYGWDTTTIWNTATVGSLGRPTLLQNPE
ncbi:Ig-like domain-containing protein [Selenomonadales bacterium OttesenSCG-928-I06]|nr:Ig-like domain-containing protein [Selenomonadales bacterium OttesenSCG-928-I06]